MTAVALIPARGGSKGIPNKNLELVGGKPMIEWTIAAAIASNCCARIIVSTDSDEIATAAERMGAEVPFMRPAELADDHSTTASVLIHAAGYFSEDDIILLQPTSPLRTAADIATAYATYREIRRPVVSVCEAKPWLFTRLKDGGLVQLTELTSQRQKSSVVAPNGAIYIFSRGHLDEGRSWWDDAVAFEMPYSRSIDIDKMDELKVVDAIMRAETMC